MANSLTVMRHLPGKLDRLSVWLRELLDRRPFRLVSSALANKLARIAWAVMKRQDTYCEFTDSFHRISINIQLGVDGKRDKVYYPYGSISYDPYLRMEYDNMTSDAPSNQSGYAASAPYMQIEGMATSNSTPIYHGRNRAAAHHAEHGETDADDEKGEGRRLWDGVKQRVCAGHAPAIGIELAAEKSFHWAQLANP
jgi:hypothetical protein